MLFLLVSTEVFAQNNPSDSINPGYKNTIIYNLDVKTFKDSNDDGYGDFRGLTSKLDYLKDLGVEVIWLSPFQPSQGLDDGYDITNFYGIDPKCGTKEILLHLCRRQKHIKSG